MPSFAQGVDFDLLSHGIAVISAVLQHLPQSFQAQAVAAARFAAATRVLRGETFLTVSGSLGGVPVQAAGGKYLPPPDVKRAVFNYARGNVTLDLVNDTFVAASGDVVLAEGPLERRHVERFLEAALSDDDPQDAPGVMDLSTALGILEALERVKTAIQRQARDSGMADYHEGDAPGTILEAIKARSRNAGPKP
ncbi:MAG: hypothetical protein FJ315_02905 [SAR202 cluster bacterium]|nr:hypothetical protein [SAR202 cluster bacterium]